MTDATVLLDRTITLRTPTTTGQDGSGAAILSWAEEEIPAAITFQLNKSESIAASHKEVAFNTMVFTIRYRSNLTEKQEIVYEGKTYDILGITEVPRRRYSRIVGEMRR